MWGLFFTQQISNEEIFSMSCLCDVCSEIYYALYEYMYQHAVLVCSLCHIDLLGGRYLPCYISWCALHMFSIHQYVPGKMIFTMLYLVWGGFFILNCPATRVHPVLVFSLSYIVLRGDIYHTVLACGVFFILDCPARTVFSEGGRYWEQIHFWLPGNPTNGKRTKIRQKTNHLALVCLAEHW